MFRHSADGNVVSAAYSALRVLFYLKWPFKALGLSVFLPLYKFFIRPQLEYAIQAPHPIPPRRGIGKGTKARESSWKGFGMSRMEQLSNSFENSLLFTP